MQPPDLHIPKDLYQLHDVGFPEHTSHPERIEILAERISGRENRG